MTDTMEDSHPAGTATRMAYKPVGIVSGMVAGAIASAVFRQVWKHISDKDGTPRAMERQYAWRQVLLAAIIQGAIFSGVRAIVQRGGAEGFRRVTGTWPGTDSRTGGSE